MKLTRHSYNPILTKNPNNPWEARSVFNPSVLYDNGIFRMVYRATSYNKIDKEHRCTSAIGYAESTDGIHFTRFSKPLIKSDQEYEIKGGCEDPRVTKIDGTYFLYYTARRVENNKMTVRLALATSKDFKNWKKHGIVGPATRSKAACLFPEKINRKYSMFYTWMSDRPISSIMHIQFDALKDIMTPPRNLMANNIEHYDQNVVFEPPLNVYRGAEVGAVPIKTEDGWLFIYCNANVSDHPEWTISAALLDLDDPRKILAETKEPILAPETEAERFGIVNNVTFPQGALVVGKDLYVYYGSGDQEISLATCNLKDLMKDLLSRIPRKQ